MYKFSKPRWTVGTDGIIRYKCNDAVYGWITNKIKGKLKWKAVMTYNYGNADGESLKLSSAKKCIAALIEATKSSLYLQQKNKSKEED